MLAVCGAQVAVSESRVENPWRELIYDRFRGLPAPLLCFAEGIIPAASLWTGSRVWLGALRELGCLPGDRIACALPPGPSFVMLLLAALWEGFSIALLPPAPVQDQTLDYLDARVLVSPFSGAGIGVDRDGLPEFRSGQALLRTCRSPRTPGIQLLARSSGSTGEGRWVAVSSENLLSVLRSHLPLLGLDGARLLSVLPWHHLFGLSIELLPALFAGAEVIRASQFGKCTGELVGLGEEHEITHLSGVPLTFLRLLQWEGGPEFLRRLRGGVVGGAPIVPRLADALHGSRLRVGYGQTEAGPGITLGAPGEFFPFCLGRPVGCEVRISTEGVLEYRGANACLGYWMDGALHAFEEDWRASGDLAEWAGETLRFVGRADDRFKLANGKMVSPLLIEERLRALTRRDWNFWVFTPDNRTLSLCHGGSPGWQPSSTLLKDALGGLSELCREVRPLPPECFHRTAKGDLNRRRMFAQISGSL